jgi:hypothetical protein
MMSLINQIMDMDNRSIEQRVIKTGEEYGEMCEAVSSASGVIGCEYKGKTMDDVVEESWDTIICALSVALQAKPSMTPKEHKELFMRKLIKWEQKVKEGQAVTNA